jgi:hypothetical protein
MSKKASLGEEALTRKRTLDSIGRTLREEYDISQPLPDSLANLAGQIAQLTDDKNPPRDDVESTIFAGMKYYFHVSQGRHRQYRDDSGGVFTTPDEAITHASVLAAKLLRDEGWDVCVISVTNKDGNVFAQIAVGS